MKVYRERPYVICHVLSSVDGRISGSYFRIPETGKARQIYNEIREQYHCAAVMNGAVTCAQIYADGLIGGIPKAGRNLPREDFAAETDLQSYVVCVDPEGSLKWSRNRIRRSSQPESHVIEVLTENVPDDYIGYLRKLDISYIFAGKDKLDTRAAMRKLKEMFHIDSLLLTGGGIMDWSVLQAGMMDEVSIVVSPAVSGETDVATAFDRSAFLPDGCPVPLDLTGAREMGDGVLWLNYRPKNIQETTK